MYVMCTVLLVSRVVINGGVGGCALDRALGRERSGDVYIVIVSMGDGWERKGIGGSDDKCCRSVE
jgi:hypothetical protein